MLIIKGLCFDGWQKKVYEDTIVLGLMDVA